MVSYVVSETLTMKICSLTSAIINVADNANLAAKITITQEEESIASSTTHVEASFSETPKASATYYTKNIPQKSSATMIASSKTRNYHISEILYNLYKDNIFQNKKHINFISITAP